MKYALSLLFSLLFLFTNSAYAQYTQNKNEELTGLTNLCEKTSIIVSRKLFQHLYQHQQYEMAYNTLKNISTHCENIADVNQLFWLRSDMLLSLIKLKKNNECTSLAKSITSHPKFSATTPQFQKSIMSNIKLCETIG